MSLEIKQGQRISSGTINQIVQAVLDQVRPGAGTLMNRTGSHLTLGSERRHILRGGAGTITVAATQSDLGTPATARLGLVTAYVTGSATVTSEVLMLWDDAAASAGTPAVADWRRLTPLEAVSVSNLGTPSNPPAFGIVDTGTDNRVMYMPADGTTNSDWIDLNHYGTAA